MVTWTSKPESCTRNRRPPRPGAPSPAPSGNPLWGCRAPPQTEVIMTVVSLCTDSGVRGGVGRASPKGGDARRTSPPGSYSAGSVTHHRTDSLLLQTPCLPPSFARSSTRVATEPAPTTRGTAVAGVLLWLLWLFCLLLLLLNGQLFQNNNYCKTG